MAIESSRFDRRIRCTIELFNDMLIYASVYRLSLASHAKSRIRN